MIFGPKRKMAILVITIAAAVLTPGQDPFSMLLLAIPMILLYELGIVMIGRNHPKDDLRGMVGLITQRER